MAGEDWIEQLKGAFERTASAQSALERESDKAEREHLNQRLVEARQEVSAVLAGIRKAAKAGDAEAEALIDAAETESLRSVR